MLFFLMIVIVFALLAYVVLDGYDLGIGVLTLFQPDAARRRQMLEVVGNVWDGNESWLIMLAMGLWAVMPDAFATALPGLYIPLLVMIFGLIFRGFAVEMALHRAASDRTWTRLFGVGSLVAAFAQGVLFGGLLCGVTVRNQLFAGATWDFFGHGYAVLTGLVTVTLFGLAGAAMLQAKTGGALRAQMVGLVRPLTLVTVSGVALSAALLPVVTTARLYLGAVDRWLPFGYAVLVAVGGFWTAYRRAGRAPDLIPFLAVTAVETAGLVALLALYFPQVVPPSVTLYSAGASRETLAFLVIAVCLFVPGTIAYHAYSNWVFRGRQPLDDAAPDGRHAAPSAVPGPQPVEGGS
ncbi:MAG TPA: cytochrome d ubiquinol oxidase subunit II [Trebonia sp.]|jgi:cytochrome d ubiquinol oxidase subunit II